MSESSLVISGRGTFPRGLHPPDRKELSAGAPIEVLPAPAAVSVPLLQHTGAPCRATVKTKDNVAVGQLVGEIDAFISAPVHSPINGIVQRASMATLPNGRHVQTVEIKADGDQPGSEQVFDEILGGDWPTQDLEQYDPQQIIEAVHDAGIVGLGGAAFPTHVKLTPNEARPIDTLIVNGCECEPYITADHRLMLEAPRAIVTGALLSARACKAERIVVAVEDNKPDAIESIRSTAEGTGIDVIPLKTKYPQGGERQAVPAMVGREIPTGGLPLDVGVVVVNVGTAAAVSGAVIRKRALTHRVVAVSGEGIQNPKNILAPIGVSIGEIIEYCGGLRDDAARVIAGGPMTGFAIGDPKTPLTKGTGGITALSEARIHRVGETECIRCGRCVDVCPLNLVPTKIAMAARAEDWDLARQYYITACMECGCCSYICPAGIQLVQLIRDGKAKLPKD